MTQGEVRHSLDVLLLDTCCVAPGGMRARGTQPDQVATQAIHTGREAALGDVGERSVVQRDGVEPQSCHLAAGAQLSLGSGPFGKKTLGVAVEGQAPTDDLLTRFWLRLGIQDNVQPEAVEQLAPLNLGDATQRALLSKSGELGELLAMVEAAEHGDLVAVADGLETLQLPALDFNRLLVEANLWMLEVTGELGGHG